MRFQITLGRKGKPNMLPMDYQYFISAWIYKVISTADNYFANFLHSQGYTEGNKKFKFFNYSPLNFGKPILWKEKSLFEINAVKVTLKVSFHVSNLAEKFIIGLFNNQNLHLGDRFNGIDFLITQVERLPDIPTTLSMNYKALSPIVISIQENHEKQAQYLSPEYSNYGLLLKNHLVFKYNASPDKVALPENFDFGFKLKNKPKSKLITIKPYTNEQTKIRGFLYNFTLTAPTQIHQLILNAGCGEKNASGFGWVEVI